MRVGKVDERLGNRQDVVEFEKKEVSGELAEVFR
jgi:hypothetical protein